MQCRTAAAGGPWAGAAARAHVIAAEVLLKGTKSCADVIVDDRRFD
jgi:hypothetical protein